MVNIALPTIGRDLRAPFVQLTWVVSAYAVAFGGLLLLGGRLADVAGRRRLFVLGLLTFAVASAIGATASTAEVLIAARAAQGIGAALTAPAALALLSTLYPDPPTRGRALGILAAAAGAGGSTGLLLGGLLTEVAGWRSVLWINVPLAAVILATVPALPAAAPGPHRRQLGVPAALLATSATATFVAAMLQATQVGWTSWRTLLILATSAVLLASFVLTERASRTPLVPHGVIRAHGVVAADLVSAVLAAAMTPMWFLLAIHLQANLDLEPLAAGVAVVPLSLTMVAINLVVPRILARTGSRRTLLSGSALGGAGLLWLAMAAATPGSTAYLVLPSLLTAVGLGAAFVAGVMAATVPVSDADSGSAAGMVSAAQQVGGAVGLAAAVSLASAVSPDGQVPGGVPAGLALAAAFAFVAALVALWAPRRHR